MGGLTTVGVGLVEVRRGGRLNGQLRPRHLTRHRVTATQSAHATAVFSVRAHLERGEREREREREREKNETAALFPSGGNKTRLLLK